MDEISAGKINKLVGPTSFNKNVGLSISQNSLAALLSSPQESLSPFSRDPPSFSPEPSPIATIARALHFTLPHLYPPSRDQISLSPLSFSQDNISPPQLTVEPRAHWSLPLPFLLKPNLHIFLSGPDLADLSYRRLLEQAGAIWAHCCLLEQAGAFWSSPPSSRAKYFTV